MTIQTRTTLKTYFEKGDKPTEAQFVNLIDSCLNLSDTAAQTITSPITVTGAITANGGITGTLTGNATNITGTAAVANGGTGATALTAHGVVIGNATAAVNVTTAGTAGQVLTSNGASADPTFQAVPAPSSIASSAITGTTTNDDAAAGKLGEYISQDVLIGSAVSLSTGSTSNIASISLTAGDWDVNGAIYYSPAGGTVLTALYSSIGTTSATLPTAPGKGAMNSWIGSTTGIQMALATGIVRLSLSTTTTVYLLANATFTTSTAQAFGFIGARRAR